MELKVGDVVKLKSGGSMMVIQLIVEGISAICIWHTMERPMQATYSVKILEKVEDF